MKSTFVDTKQKISIRTIAPVAIIALGFSILASGGFFFWKSVQPPVPTSKTPTMESLTTELLDLNTQYKKGPASGKSQKLTSLRSVAEKRQRLAAALLKSDPEKFLKASLKKSDRQSLPTEIQSLVEQRTSLQGELQIEHADNFKQGIATYSYSLKTKDQKEFTLNFSGDATNLVSGSTIKVSGVQLDAAIAVPLVPSIPETGMAAGGDVLGLQSLSQPATEAAVVGPKKVAVILVAFQNDPAFLTTPAVAQSVVFGSVRLYYSETSLSNLDLTGKNNVGGVIGSGDVHTTTLGVNRGASCDKYTWGNLADQNLGSTLSGYDYFIYMFKPGSGCPQGVTSIGSNKSYVTQSNIITVGHELGHGFGTHHASSYACTDGLGNRVPISNTCTKNEYGDPFDIMGNSSTRQMNNFHKGQTGWLQPNEIQDISESGTYTLWPVEVATTNPASPKVKTLRIPRTYFNGVPNEYYYLEFRQPIGAFDNFAAGDPVVNGVSIRLAPDYAQAFQSKLLDTTSLTSNFSDSALLVNQTFTDPDHGLSVTLQPLPGDKSYASVSITVECNRNKPNGLMTVSPDWIWPGQTTSVTVDFHNNDSPLCPSSDFTIQPSILPIGWSQSPNQVTVSGLPPLTSGTATFSVTAPSNATDGLMNIDEIISHGAVPGLTWTLNQQIGVDTAPPTVTIINPVNGGELPVAGTVQISSTADDANYIASMEISIDGGSVKQCSGGSCNYDWLMTGLTQGYHTVRVTATDAGQRIGSQSVKVCYPFSGTGERVGCSRGGSGIRKLPE